MMRTFKLEIRFTTPAFMGNAIQDAQWRTPPIKALLRQWWRVAYAMEKHFAVNLKDMRHEERVLFGHAWLENDTFDRDGKPVETSARKSQIRIRLDRWREGTLKQDDWPAVGTVRHPESQRAVAADLYLGYGPVMPPPRGGPRPTLKARAAIQANESAILSVAVPETHAPLIRHAFWLMNQYGTLGGRSRNGWGSFSLLPSPLAEEELGEREIRYRLWTECLRPDCDWPHAIGKDARGALIWQTGPHEDWKSLMKTLAETKMGLRTQFKFPKGTSDGRVHERHWLCYPVNPHKVSAWDEYNSRLPNTLRFKIRQCQDGKLVGVIFHVPHLPPAAFRPDRPAIEAVWTRVHAFLDNRAPKIARIPE